MCRHVIPPARFAHRTNVQALVTVGTLGWILLLSMLALRLASFRRELLQMRVLSIPINHTVA